jgi:hypothetical protein
VFFYTTHLTKVQVPLSIPSAKLHTLKNAVLETVPNEQVQVESQVLSR